MGEKKIKFALILLIALLSISLISAENQTTNESINQTIEIQNTNNESENTTSQEEEIKVPTIELGIQDSIDLGETNELEIMINPEERDITKIKIDWDNEDTKTITSPSLSSIGIYSIEEEYEYEESGTFTIKVDVYCSDSICASQTISLEVEEPEIVDEKPTVTLISPSDEYLSKQSTVNFEFKVNDDYKIDSCTFELYKKNSDLDKLEYTHTNESIKINTKMKLPLKEFDDGNYSWYVICEDNNSQEDEKSRDLTIKTVNHPREKEILSLLDKIDEFLEKKESMTPEELEALEELTKAKIIEPTYYKKRLIQINQDLGNNLKYTTDSTLREKLKVESHLELDEIKEKIPYKIEIINEENFVKNSLPTSLESITQRYVDSQKLELSQNKIKRLVKNNEEFQSKITTKSSIKQVKITYNDSSQTITLVKKNVLISDPQITKILEVFPENFEQKIEFNTKPIEIAKNLYEIKLNDLENFEIKYIIKEKTNIGVLKEVQTIVFKENALSKNMITGLSIFEEGINSTSNYIIISLIIIAIFFYLYKKLIRDSSKKWSKNENTRKINKSIKEAQKSIKEKDIAKAKEEYHKIKEKFNTLPEEFKHEEYQKIEKIRIEIDKSDMKNLIREYEKAKRENRKEDSKKLYRQISTKYKNLPKKYQEKVYKRIINK